MGLSSSFESRIIDPDPVDATSTQPLSLHHVLRRHTGDTSDSAIVYSVCDRPSTRSGAPPMPLTTQLARRLRVITKEVMAGRGPALGDSPVLGTVVSRCGRRQSGRES